MNNPIRSILHHLLNIRGWSSPRKIVVLESDDWGSIRMPSKGTYQFLKDRGYQVDRDPYLKYDALASEQDLTHLFEVLCCVKDKHGNSALLTANCILANPDFEKIREDGFSSYRYERFTETFKRYPTHANSFNLWQEGIKNRIFQPQFHGRDHLNISRWMQALRTKEYTARMAFDLNMISISSEPVEKPVTYMESMEFESDEEKIGINDSLAEGLELFKQIFGHRSASYIPTCYTWDSFHERVLSENGVKYLQGIPFQRQPIFSNGSFQYKNMRHYTGQENSHNQTYLVRNVFFEPSIVRSSDVIGECLRRISIAFRWGKPAIMGAHRLNFIGHIDKDNREKNLATFRILLREMLKRWPDIEFMSTDQLGSVITDSIDVQ